MFEDEIKEIMDIKKDENLDQMIQKIDAGILKNLAVVDEQYGYMDINAQQIKDLVIARKILISEKNGHEIIEKIKASL